jgi:hypothetical protein
MPFGAAQRVWETGVLVGVAAESHAAGGLVPDHARKATGSLPRDTAARKDQIIVCGRGDEPR